MTCGVLNRTWPHAAGAEQRSTACPPAPRVWAWLGGVCLAWACAWASPAQASEGLQPKAEDFAPFVLSVPGEAMLLDPAGLSPDEDEDEDVPPLPSNPYELRETERGGASWYGARFHRRRTASHCRNTRHGQQQRPGRRPSRHRQHITDGSAEHDQRHHTRFGQ